MNGYYMITYLVYICEITDTIERNRKWIELVKFSARSLLRGYWCSCISFSFDVDIFANKALHSAASFICSSWVRYHTNRGRKTTYDSIIDPWWREIPSNHCIVLSYFSLSRLWEQRSNFFDVFMFIPINHKFNIHID